MNKENKKTMEIEGLKMKTEEDFYEEVVNTKYENAMLTEHVGVVEKENEILTEELNVLKKSRKLYIVKVESPTIKKDKNEEQEMINAGIEDIMERLLANSMDVNIELTEVIEETDEILEEYKMN